MNNTDEIKNELKVHRNWIKNTPTFEQLRNIPEFYFNYYSFESKVYRRINDGKEEDLTFFFEVIKEDIKKT